MYSEVLLHTFLCISVVGTYAGACVSTYVLTYACMYVWPYIHMHTHIRDYVRTTCGRNSPGRRPLAFLIRLKLKTIDHSGLLALAIGGKREGDLPSVQPKKNVFLLVQKNMPTWSIFDYFGGLKMIKSWGFLLFLRASFRGHFWTRFLSNFG